jgi:hypothetical protein
MVLQPVVKHTSIGVHTIDLSMQIQAKGGNGATKLTREEKQRKEITRNSFAVLIREFNTIMRVLRKERGPKEAEEVLAEIAAALIYNANKNVGLPPMEEMAIAHALIRQPSKRPSENLVLAAFMRLEEADRGNPATPK